jgi:hypothetical protein
MKNSDQSGAWFGPHPLANVYHMSDLDSCAASANEPFLPCAVQLPEYQQAFAASGPNSSIVLTVFDSTTYCTDLGDCSTNQGNYVNYSFMSSPENQQAVQSEYASLAYSLFQTQAGTGRTFIIDHWEGDNLLYCGSAYTYYKDSNFRANCSVLSNGGLSAIELWFKARHDGIVQAQSWAASAAITGVNVYDAIEFNSYLTMKNAGWPDVLHTVIHDLCSTMSACPKYASYSSWESCQHGTVDRDLPLIDALLSPYGITPFIGEYGVAGLNKSTPAWNQWLFTETTRAVRRWWNMAVAWEAYPANDLEDSLLTTEGLETPAMRSLRSAFPLRNYTYTTRNRITGILEQARVNSTTRSFELYGSYAGDAHQAFYRCNAGSGYSVATVTGENSGQINVSIPDPNPQPRPGLGEAWCVFYVQNGYGRSDDFGPTHACANAPCADILQPW